MDTQSKKNHGSPKDKEPMDTQRKKNSGSPKDKEPMDTQRKKNSGSPKDQKQGLDFSQPIRAIFEGHFSLIAVLHVVLDATGFQRRKGSGLDSALLSFGAFCLDVRTLGL